MTADQLIKAGTLLYGSDGYWKPLFAHDFGLSIRGLRRLTKDQSDIGEELEGRIIKAVALRGYEIDTWLTLAGMTGVK